MHIPLLDTIKVYFGFLVLFLKSCFFVTKTTQKQKRLFVVTTHLPPNSGGGVFRPFSFLKNAKSNGWGCHAFCFDHRVDNIKAGEYLLNQLEDKRVLHRIKLSELKPSWKLTPRIDGGLVNSLKMANSILKLGLEVPSVILASGPQFNSFITGYFLARTFRAKLVLDYRDEWSLCPFEWVEKSKFDQIVERYLCSKADKIIFTTQSHLQNHQSHFGNVAIDKRIVLANGYDESDLASCMVSNTENKYFTLSFIGVLGDHSLPKEFISALGVLLESNPQLKKVLRVQFIGNKSAQAESILNNFKFQKNIKIIGHVAKIEALNLMSESDALLVLAGKGMKDYIPGKLFDYLSLKKPILYFGEQGEASAIVDSLEAGFSISDGDLQGLADCLNKLAQKELVIDESKIDMWIKNYTRSHLANKLYKELTGLIEKQI